MYQAATIGKNFDTTARLIDDPVSEWYVPPVSPLMDFETLKANYNRLIDQISMWADKLVNANRKEVANLNKIIEVQQGKADKYDEKISSMTPGQNPGNGGGTQTPPIMQKNKTLLYVGMAALAFVLIKKIL